MNKILLFICLFLTQFSLLAGPVVVLPERYKDKKVINVNSEELKELVNKNKELAKQLQEESKNWKSYSEEVDNRLQKSWETNNSLIKDLEAARIEKLKLDKSLVEKDLAILWRNIIIASLILLFGIYLFLKFYLHLPI